MAGGDLGNLLSGFIGAAIGGACAVVAVIIENWLNRKGQAENEQRTVVGFLQAVHDELATVWERYMRTAGATIEGLQDGGAFLSIYPVSQNYFVVYDSNSFLVSRIENIDLRRLMILTYVRCKGMVDSFRMNNELIAKYEHAALMAGQMNTPVLIQAAEAHRLALVNYAVGLRQHHAELKNHLRVLLDLLAQEIGKAKPIEPPVRAPRMAQFWSGMRRVWIVGAILWVAYAVFVYGFVRSNDYVKLYIESDIAAVESQITRECDT